MNAEDCYDKTVSSPEAGLQFALAVVTQFFAPTTRKGLSTIAMQLISQR
jgi:hypothetical protein